MVVNNLNDPSQSTVKFKIILLYWCILIIAIKNESLIINPRFWAEEATVYFKYATEHSFLNSLVASHIDYYALIPNLATAIAAHYSPLKMAPIVTTLFAFACQTIPVAIIVFGRCNYWNSPLKKIIMATTALTIAEPEIWLNSVNSQFFLGLATILIFLESEFAVRSTFKFHCAILVLAGLTGPVSAFFFPLFLYKYLMLKSKALRIFTVISFFTSTIQATVFLYHFVFKFPERSRFGTYHLDSLLTSIFSHFFGLFKFISVNDKKNVGIVIFTFFVYILYKEFKSKERLNNYLIAAFLIVSILSILGSLGMNPGSRYGYIPSFLLATLIYSFVFGSKVNSANNLRYVLSCVIFVLTFTSYIFFYRDDRSHQFSGPLWAAEVENRKNDATYPIKIHPTGWEVTFQTSFRKE